MEHLGEDKSIDYIEGRLPENQKTEWAAHVDKCGPCARNVQDWDGILENLNPSGLSGAPADEVLKAIEIFPVEAKPMKSKVMFAALIFDSYAQPAFAGLRGPMDARQLVLRTENLDIDLHISRLSGRTTVWGQLLPRIDNAAISRVQVTLMCDGERYESARTNSSGEFRFEGVPEGELSIGVYLPSMSRQVFGVFKIQRN